MSEESSSQSSSSTEPLSPNKQALLAITAQLQGKATGAQKKIVLGDKSVEYMSLSELLQLKEYFEREVRKEDGQPLSIKAERLYVRWR